MLVKTGLASGAFAFLWDRLWFWYLHAGALEYGTLLVHLVFQTSLSPRIRRLNSSALEILENSELTYNLHSKPLHWTKGGEILLVWSKPRVSRAHIYYRTATNLSRQVLDARRGRSWSRYVVFCRSKLLNINFISVGLRVRINRFSSISMDIWQTWIVQAATQMWVISIRYVIADFALGWWRIQESWSLRYCLVLDGCELMVSINHELVYWIW